MDVIFCVCGMKLHGGHHYGKTRFSREQGIELIKEAKLEEIFSLKALGGSAYYSEAKLLGFMSDLYQYNERVYIAERIIDNLFLNMQGVSSEDFHIWKFSNARRQEQIEDLSDDWKKQLSLAKQGHPWFASLPKFSSHMGGGLGGLRGAPNSAGGSGGRQCKRRASGSGGKQRVDGGERDDWGDEDEDDGRDLFGDDNNDEDGQDDEDGQRRTPSQPPPQQGSAGGSGGFGSGGGSGSWRQGSAGVGVGRSDGGSSSAGNSGGGNSGGGSIGGVGGRRGGGLGERRGVGDTDETLKGLVMSHRRYVEHTSKECKATGTEPKVWVNQYMARAAGTERLV